MWNKCQRSKIEAAEMSHLRGGCGMNRMDGDSDENIYRRFGMASKAGGLSCGVVMEVVKCSTRRWLGQRQ